MLKNRCKMEKTDKIKNPPLQIEERALELCDAFETVFEQPIEEVQTEDKNHSCSPIAPQSSEKKSAKKRASDDKQHVYGYMKKKILNYLEENDCSSNSVNNVIAASKFDRDLILEYLNLRMEMAQMNVHEECESTSFTNIESWLEQFKKWNLPQACLYEPALVMNAIANNEDIPPPEQLEGVDLRSVYRFLGNALMGLPQPKLNPKSAEFLAKEFEILISEANTSVGDEETGRLYKRLQSYKVLPAHSQNGKSSIDPLCIDDAMKTQLD